MIMKVRSRRRLIGALGVVVLAVIGALAWLKYGGNEKDTDIASGNGRIEAVEIDVAAKSPGRLKEVLVREGAFVKAGQVVARMDTDVLMAQLRQAQAQLHQANSTVVTARSQLRLREAEKKAAIAVLAQREAELDIAKKRLSRSARLVREGHISKQQLDDDSARVKGAASAVGAAHAQIAAADAAIAAARAQVAGAQSAVQAAQASTDRIQADIDDGTLRAPRAGRVQYIVARPGEVVGAGGRILSLVDLSDVYMTFFLPTAAAGRLAIGAPARIVLDPAPQYVIPANISFVADVAQFTPKTVETASEREKLMFRVRAKIPPDLLKKYMLVVKTGVPGTAYVLTDPKATWPDRLKINLPH